MNTTQLQTDLAARGLYTDRIDGIWGRNSEEAYRELLERADACAPAPSADGMAWGAKVSAEFKAKVRSICDRLGIPDPSALMACMAWESAETFSPDIRNMAGSGATGLIQFMPATARGLGTTTDKLAAMSAIDQLDYVEKYFQPYRGKLKNLGDIYMAILWPRGIGKADDWTLWDRKDRPTTYRQNAGLDMNGDGKIIRAEAVAKVQQKLNKGMQAPYYG